MDMTLWQPLFEAGLPRPTFNGNPLIAHDSFPGRLCYSPAPGAVIYLDEEDTAALIRDKAVWWLLSRPTTPEGNDETRGPYCLRRVLSRYEDKWEISEYQEHGSCQGDSYSVFDDEASHADPTEALYLACCKAMEIEP